MDKIKGFNQKVHGISIKDIMHILKNHGLVNDDKLAAADKLAAIYPFPMAYVSVAKEILSKLKESRLGPLNPLEFKEFLKEYPNLEFRFSVPMGDSFMFRVVGNNPLDHMDSEEIEEEDEIRFDDPNLMGKICVLADMVEEQLNQIV